MSDISALYRNILENMSDGVVTVDRQGVVRLFNPAAAAALGLDADQVLGQPFALAFLGESGGGEDFVQVVLDAVYDGAVGASRTVQYRRDDGRVLALAMTSSYLRDEAGQPVGVIVVFSDVTEMQQLQETEKDLNRRLRDAFLDLEGANEGLRAALRQTRIVRLAVVILLGLGAAGFFALQGEAPQRFQDRPTADRQPAGFSAIPVTVQPLSVSISLAGRLEPIQDVNLVCPYAGKILEKRFEYGQLVQKGDVLLRLDAEDLQVRLRESRAACIGTEKRLREVEGWAAGTEMAQARRSLVKARAHFDAARKKLEETEALHGKGIVAANEVDAARVQFMNAELDLRGAEDELRSTERKGDPDAVRMARMEFENARTRRDELERLLGASEIRAPVSGLVILPVARDNERRRGVEPGAQAAQGELLLAVGSLEGMRVRARVDEVDVRKLMPGQPVRVRGDAFPGLTLEGRVSHISSQASTESSGGKGTEAPGFDVLVAIPRLTEEERGQVRIGMTAALEIVVRENPAALMIPLAAVRSEGGRRLVGRLDMAAGAVGQAEVVTGVTTLDAVEIVGGLAEGDEIVLPGAGPDLGPGSGPPAGR